MTLLACSTCQVNMAVGGGDAAGWSILFLLGVILSMLAAVVWAMARVMRRESDSLDPELRDDTPSRSL